MAKPGGVLAITVAYPQPLSESCTTMRWQDSFGMALFRAAIATRTCKLGLPPSSVAMSPTALSTSHCSSTGIYRQYLDWKSNQPKVARSKAPIAVSDAPVIPCQLAKDASAATASSPEPRTTAKILCPDVFVPSFDFISLRLSLRVQPTARSCASYSPVCAGLGGRSRSARDTSSAVAIAQ